MGWGIIIGGLSIVVCLILAGALFFFLRPRTKKPPEVDNTRSMRFQIVPGAKEIYFFPEYLTLEDCQADIAKQEKAQEALFKEKREAWLEEHK